MAGPCACQSLYQNLSLASKDKLTGTAPRVSSIDDNCIFSYTFIVSHVYTFAPLFALTFTKLAAKYINVNLQKAIKFALKLFVQGQQQAQMAPQII